MSTQNNRTDEESTSQFVTVSIQTQVEKVRKILNITAELRCVPATQRVAMVGVPGDFRLLHVRWDTAGVL
nr:hypothetical protein BaRGS_013882 [Batillaria attramentaria]